MAIQFPTGDSVLAGDTSPGYRDQPARETEAASNFSLVQSIPRDYSLGLGLGLDRPLTEPSPGTAARLKGRRGGGGQGLEADVQGKRELGSDCWG